MTFKCNHIYVFIYFYQLIAFKCNNTSSYVENSAVIIIDDLNNNRPIINFDETKIIEIWESEFATLFDFTDLYVNDIDLGLHATYTVSLSPSNNSQPFTIVPSNGYQLQQFSISVINAEILDYDKTDRWREFVLTITAEETNTTEHFSDSKDFTVKLKNWNDEIPVFSSSNYEFKVLESINKDELIGQIFATDQDIDDKLVYYSEGQILEIVTINNSSGVLSAAKNDSFDYEQQRDFYFQVFVNDTLVTDKNEQTHTAFAQVHIIVEDVNDNPPEFIGNTLQSVRRVVEEAETDIFVGFILARDIDGPGNNEITYNMIPLDAETDGWLKIDNVTGEIFVDANKSIDCDEPNPRFTLDYTIVLFDGVHTTEGNISVYITDINNKVPQIDEFDDTIEIFETASDLQIANISAHDDDRDAPHNELVYSIDYRTVAENDRFFEIDPKTGILKVKVLSEPNVLDRDNGVTKHFILINVDDNNGVGIFYRNFTNVTVILKDCNDNAPELPDVLSSSTLSESFNADAVIIANFYAPDKDEGDNSLVDYDILKFEYSDMPNTPENCTNLFKIDTQNGTHANILAAKSFRKCSGDWLVTIQAKDRGNLTECPGVSLSSTKTYQIKIEPYNFDTPTIIFPQNNQEIFLDLITARIDTTLKYLDGSDLRLFEAEDSDVGIYGNVTMQLITDSGDHEFFSIHKRNDKRSELFITKNVEENTYSISLLAIDGGLRQSDFITNIKITFVNRTGDPYFVENEFRTDFTENEGGLSEIRKIPEAMDPKNMSIYYFIDQSFNPQEARLFKLDKFTRELRLSEELDRENIAEHHIRIIATNSVNYPIAEITEKSMLTVTITVNDVNDNPPKFVRLNYTVGISEADNLDKTLITFNAPDPDLDDRVTYHILSDTMNASSTTLFDIKDTAFTLESNSGRLLLKFQVLDAMSGYFQFTVQARDLVNHTDEAFVRIYTVAEINRVSFTFCNTTEEVRSVDQQGVIDILTSAYDAECVNDDILTHLRNGVANETLSDYRAHFLKDNEALDRREIGRRSEDNPLVISLSGRLRNEHNLILCGIPTVETEAESESNALEISLGTVCGVLGLLLIGLIVFHVYQTRNYNRQIKALSQSSFDPNTFNKVALPNTNLYASEKSNPVMMDADLQNIMFSDTKSIVSSTDSDDFAGLQNNTIFDISSKVDDPSNNSLARNGSNLSKDSFA